VTTLFSQADHDAVVKSAKATPLLRNGLVAVSVLAIFTAALSLWGNVQIRALLKSQEDARSERSAALNDQLASIKGLATLVADCVGQTQGGPCQMNLQRQQAQALGEFQTGLIAAVVPAVVKALEEKFGILQGRLVIRVERTPGGDQVISVGSQNPGQAPGKQAPLPPGAPPSSRPTVVQECVVELHAEPLIGACALPR
jgi:hypothetical protein